MTVKLVMVRDQYGCWHGERRTLDQRFRVVRQKDSRGGQAIEYAVYDRANPKVVTVYASTVTIDPVDFMRSTIDVEREEVWPNTTVSRLCDARDWIEETIASTSAVDRLAWLAHNTEDASADAT